MQEASWVGPFISIREQAPFSHSCAASAVRTGDSCRTPELLYFCQEITEWMPCSSFRTLMSSRLTVEIVQGNFQIIQGEGKAGQTPVSLWSCAMRNVFRNLRRKIVSWRVLQRIFIFFSLHSLRIELQLDSFLKLEFLFHMKLDLSQDKIWWFLQSHQCLRHSQGIYLRLLVCYESHSSFLSFW